MGRSDYSLALGTVPEVNPSDRTIQSLQEWRHKMDSLERNQTPARKHDRDSVYPCRPTSRLRLDAQAGNSDSSRHGGLKYAAPKGDTTNNESRPLSLKSRNGTGRPAQRSSKTSNP